MERLAMWDNCPMELQYFLSNLRAGSVSRLGIFTVVLLVNVQSTPHAANLDYANFCIRQICLQIHESLCTYSITLECTYFCYYMNGRISIL